MSTKGKAKRGAKASDTQKNYLVEFLQNRPDLANDKFPKHLQSSNYRDNEWELLSVELNSLGGAIKTASKWRKYWKDLTINVRNRDNSIKQKLLQSGINGFLPMREQPEIDLKILSIITTEEYIKHDQGSVNEEAFEKVHITRNNSKPKIDVCEPEMENDDSQCDEFYPSQIEVELSICSNDSTEFKQATPSMSTGKEQQKRKRTFFTPLSDNASHSSKYDSFFKFYMEMEQKKLKLKERKIELMEENNQIQIEIKNGIDILLQELHNKNKL
ncbi:uncharacterized protein LOC129945557 [Eupeodes corollae]|uniref:uncharacterized protein LOC129945557 n=1 Tax=Eupeodes corollae TaxID=290404 RepID=UPI00248FA6FE|nr:uncharacterized protein LOC129945557 [Eupeodes corollae]